MEHFCKRVVVGYRLDEWFLVSESYIFSGGLLLIISHYYYFISLRYIDLDGRCQKMTNHIWTTHRVFRRLFPELKIWQYRAKILLDFTEQKKSFALPQKHRLHKGVSNVEIISSNFPITFCFVRRWLKTKCNCNLQDLKTPPKILPVCFSSIIFKSPLNNGNTIREKGMFLKS